DPAAEVQGPASGGADQVGRHARPGRDHGAGAGHPARPARARRGHGHHRPVPAALRAPPPGAALLDARRVQGAGGVRHVAGLQPRGFGAAGALFVPRRPPGDGGRRGRLRRPRTCRTLRVCGNWRSGGADRAAAPAFTWPAAQPDRVDRATQLCALARGQSMAASSAQRPRTAYPGSFSMKLNRLTAVTLIALALAVPLGLMARSEGDALPGAPTAEQITTPKLVYGLLSDSRYAYRPRPLDATMSVEIFDHYLEALDGSKLFFTAEDIARFKTYRASMGENVRSGNLEPAYTMFAIYKQRVADRVAYA